MGTDPVGVDDCYLAWKQPTVSGTVVVRVGDGDEGCVLLVLVGEEVDHLRPFKCRLLGRRWSGWFSSLSISIFTTCLIASPCRLQHMAGVVLREGLG